MQSDQQAASLRHCYVLRRRMATQRVREWRFAIEPFAEVVSRRRELTHVYRLALYNQTRASEREYSQGCYVFSFTFFGWRVVNIYIFGKVRPF